MDENQRLTPITNQAARWGDLQGYEVVTADFSRNLERQLAEASEQRDRLAEALEYSSGALVALGEIEPDIWGLSMDTKNKTTGEVSKITMMQIVELVTAALAAVKGEPQ